METSNNGHHLELEQSSNHPGQPSYQMIVDHSYLKLSLNPPSSRQVMQLIPLISSCVSFNNSLFYRVSSTLYPFYAPIIGMTVNYQFVGYYLIF